MSTLPTLHPVHDNSIELQISPNTSYHQTEELPLTNPSEIPNPNQHQNRDRDRVPRPSKFPSKFFIHIILPFYDPFAILITSIDILLKYYIIYLQHTSLQDSEYGEYILALFLSYSVLIFYVLFISFFLFGILPNERNIPPYLCIPVFAIRFPLAVIVAPFAPFIVYMLRIWHLSPILKKYLHVILRAYVKPPPFDEEYDKPENEHELNLYRWIRIQRWRHRGFFIQTVASGVIGIVHLRYLIFGEKSIRNDLAFVLMYPSVVISALSIITKSMIYQVRKTLLLQSYVLNFAVTSYANLCLFVLF